MVCWATGGPQKYTGRSMKDSHQHLMITAAEWEAFLDDLQQTLDKFAVPQAEQAEIKTIVASIRLNDNIGSRAKIVPPGHPLPRSNAIARAARVADTWACPTKRGKPATCSLQTAAGSLRGLIRTI
jgi:hypothetical protein